MNNKMTHQNTLLTQTKMCPKGFDDEQLNLRNNFSLNEMFTNII